MKTLRAKIKKTSPYYSKGIDNSGKGVWLAITGFKETGTKNFKLKAIKSIRTGIPVFEEIWVSPSDITTKHIDVSQMTLDLISEEEKNEQIYNPKLFNRKRFEAVTENEKQYFYAPDFEKAKDIAKQLGMPESVKIVQVSRLNKKELF